MGHEHPYPAAFRGGDLVTVSGRLGGTCAGALVPEFFAEPRPACNCPGVASLPYSWAVEGEALARVRDV